jgi:hypothetical protein
MNMNMFGPILGAICLILAIPTNGMSLMVYVFYLLIRIGWNMGNK